MKLQDIIIHEIQRIELCAFELLIEVLNSLLGRHNIPCNIDILAFFDVYMMTYFMGIISIPTASLLKGKYVFIIVQNLSKEKSSYALHTGTRWILRYSSPLWKWVSSESENNERKQKWDVNKVKMTKTEPSVKIQQPTARGGLTNRRREKRDFPLRDQFPDGAQAPMLRWLRRELGWVISHYPNHYHNCSKALFPMSGSSVSPTPWKYGMVGDSGSFRMKNK
ncbi:hypothetical protein M9H77_06938 [Catharanthus roseus]|uniref:Uncharacterized protein n=1 Tax=Catharanthus roseus TaxID=4058 RepID=A0ACC0BTX6_CATRO|nr:hypothetical protein M9H77_06938 [Catharanthus roseus]